MDNNKLPFEVQAFAKRGDSPLRPFSLRISEPEPHEEFGFQCKLECPEIRQQAMTVYASEPLYAVELGILLVRRLLKYQCIEVYDEDGQHVEFPRFADISEGKRSDVDDDGRREDSAVIATIKEMEDGQRYLIVDDLEQTGNFSQETWARRKTFAIIPLVADVSQRMLMEIGWNVFSHLETRNETLRKD